MKAVPLKTVDFDPKEVGAEGEPMQFDYAAELLGVLNQPVDHGLKISDIEQRLKLRDAIKRAQKNGQDVLDLEDADHEALATLVKDYKWRIAHEVIIDFVNDVTGD